MDVEASDIAAGSQTGGDPWGVVELPDGHVLGDLA